MGVSERVSLEYRVLVTKDPGTGSAVVEIPTLQIANLGPDVPDTPERLRARQSYATRLALIRLASSGRRVCRAILRS